MKSRDLPHFSFQHILTLGIIFLLGFTTVNAQPIDPGNQTIIVIDGQGNQPQTASIFLPVVDVFVEMPIMGMPASEIAVQLAQQLNQVLFTQELDQFHAYADVAGPLQAELQIRCNGPECQVIPDFGENNGLIVNVFEGPVPTIPLVNALPEDFVYPSTDPVTSFARYFIIPNTQNILSITPPTALEPTDQYIYGVDYTAFPASPNALGLIIETPGSYWIHTVDMGGNTQFTLLEYEMQFCDLDKCTPCNNNAQKSKLTEIVCGAPDIAIISDSVKLKTKTGGEVDPRWPTAGSEESGTSATDAKQKICAKWEAMGKQKISVGIMAHGNANGIEIGSSWLTMDNICEFAEAIKGKVSEIRLFACKVGQNADIICMLEQKSGANVIASTGTMRIVQSGTGEATTVKWYTFGEMVSWNPSSSVEFENPAQKEGGIDGTVTYIKENGDTVITSIIGAAIHPVGTPANVKADSLAKRINEQLPDFEATADGNKVTIKIKEGKNVRRVVKVIIYDETKQKIKGDPKELAGGLKIIEMKVKGTTATTSEARVKFVDLAQEFTTPMDGKTPVQIAQDLMSQIRTWFLNSVEPWNRTLLSTEILPNDDAVLKFHMLEPIGPISGDFGGDNNLDFDFEMGNGFLLPPDIVGPAPLTVPDQIIPIELVEMQLVGLEPIAVVNSLTPPFMLNPDHEHVYGIDMFGVQTDADSYTFVFERPGIYVIDVTDPNGQNIHYIVQKDVRSCTDIDECCEAESTATEIPCGAPDVAVVSSTLGLYYVTEKGDTVYYTSDWSSADVSVEAASMAAAKTAICTAFENNGSQPISVAIDAHGAVGGGFVIGDDFITLRTLKAFAKDIKGKISELRLFSCNTGDNMKFMCQIERLLGCNVIGTDGKNWDVPPGLQDETGQHWYTDGNLVSWEPGNEIAVDAQCILQTQIDPETGFMVPLLPLSPLGLFPLEEPFSGLGFPYNYPFNPIMDTIFLFPAPLPGLMPVNWAMMEIRDPLQPEQILANQAGLILENGQFAQTDGSSLVTFDLDLFAIQPLGDTVIVRIFSPGHLGVSSELFDMDSFFDIAYTVDFQMVHGDTNFDNVVDATDRANAWNFRNAVGYLPWDINLDGVVDAADRAGTWNNRNATGQ